MTPSLNLTDDQMKFMLKYAETKSMTIADLMEHITERTEDELDAEVADKAFEDFYKNPETVTHEELMKRLGFR